MSESQCLLLSRLLLMFEYLMRHLYDPPNILIDQVFINNCGDKIVCHLNSFSN